MPATSKAIRLIELTSARLRQGLANPGLISLHRSEHEISGGSLPRRLSATIAEAAGSGTEQLDGLDHDPPPLASNDLARTVLRQAAWSLDQRPLPYDRLLQLIAGVPSGVTVDLSGLEHRAVFPPRVGQIILNLLLLASDSLPAGGIVVLAGSPDDMFLRLDGPSAAWPAGMAACVVDEAAACAAMAGHAGVQMPLTALLVHASGMRLSFLLATSNRTMPPILRFGGR